MMKLSVCIAAFALLAATSEAYHSESFKQVWERSGIVAESIDYAPSQLLKVYYPSGEKANLGNELTPTEVKDQPYLSWDADKNALYTLTMIGLDSPSPLHPYMVDIRHWLTVNIPGENIGEGQNLYEFISSAPPKRTCLHRYVLLVFKQTTRIHSDVFVSKTTREGREFTDTRKLIKDLKLDPKPVAGNFYVAQYDKYVPIVHASVGGIRPYEEERSCPK